jgi:hypothetical protein
VRKVSAKVKKLKRGKDCWKHPEDNQVFCGEKKLQDIKGNSHQQDLPNGHILFHETEIPDEEIIRTVIIGIFIRGDKAMMLMVLWEKLPVEIIRKEYGGKPS